MNQCRFRGSLIDVRCSIACATGFAQLFEELHPEHAEALMQFQTRIQRSIQELGDSIYKKETLDAHDSTDTP